MPTLATRCSLLSLTLVLVAVYSCFVNGAELFAQEKPRPLVFCAQPAAMPRTGQASDSSPQGLDIAVAKLVCEKLGRKFEVHWCAGPACARSCLSEERCDLILGLPLDEGAPKQLAWSVPYAGSQFGLIVPAGVKNVRSMTDLVGRRVGIVAGSVAVPENKHTVVQFSTREELLDRFAAAKLDAAFIDADFALWHLAGHPQLELRLVSEYIPREHWNMALAGRATDGQLLVEVNKALGELATDGELAEAFGRLGVPHRPPFTGSAREKTLVDSWKKIQERGELRIGMDPANLPYSSAAEDRPGFDLELARELAREIGLKLHVEWLDIQRETALGKLLENECDLALGTPVEPNAIEDEEELAGKVIYSRPYYGTGYLLVGRQDGLQVKALTELKGERSRRLGTEAGSVADYRLRQAGYQRSLFRNQLAVLKALDDKGIDFAYLWANVGWTLHATPEFKLQIVSDYVPEDHWNVAVALRKADMELKKRVDAGLGRLVENGAVAKALAKYHVPYFPPFHEPVSSGQKAGGSVKNADGALLLPPANSQLPTAIIRHPVASRGLESQMQKVQTSRQPYSGLARLRSAGTLVVGLDQNNLPFSTAHPKPAGLDYEIAGHLAEKLGLSLQVYWAFSSHDSYPSKLASKKLCDVILGVMPDDRFGDRVLFTQPYYLAGYQYVVARDEEHAKAALDLSDESPLAIEPGVAVRGLSGRATREYAGLPEILAAVAGGQSKAGYVISTQGHWLAQRDWTDKLRFLDGDPADRFAICAAVRKSDKDLQVALNEALDDLAASGKLKAAFDHWHIPYENPSHGGNHRKSNAAERVSR